MANNPSFSFYVNDFEGGTRHMTDEELGCYVRLLIAQFNRGFLPKNEVFLSRFCTSFSKSWPIVSEKFKEIGDNKLQNFRLEKETKKRDKFIDKQSVNGSKGGRPKKNYKPKRKPKITQIETQKKPLGNGYGDGNRKQGTGMGEKETPKINSVSMPFNGEFANIWNEWKKYRWEQHEFSYKSGGTEQAALHELTSLSPVEEICISIIRQSMASGWKKFYPLKNNSNEQSGGHKQATGANVNVASAFDKINKLHSKT